MKRWIPALVLTLFCVPPALAAAVTDATGRTVEVPDRVERVLPAGPPAAVLLAAIVPGQMLGFTGPVSDAAKAELAAAASGLPTVPRLTGPQDNTAAIQALHPDLIIDYGTVSPRYKQLAEDTQKKTGIPTLLFDGALDQIPSVARTLGRILQQPDQAEAVARMAEAILALPMPAGSHPSVVLCSRRRRSAGDRAKHRRDGDLRPPGLAGGRTRRRRHLPADNGRGDPHARSGHDHPVGPGGKEVLAKRRWSGLRAVRDGHAYIAPSEPFGWIEEPPSINRLLGLAWLRGGDPLTLAALFNASVYNHVLTPAELLAVAGHHPIVQALTPRGAMRFLLFFYCAGAASRPAPRR